MKQLIDYDTELYEQLEKTVLYQKIAWAPAFAGMTFRDIACTLRRTAVKIKT